MLATSKSVLFSGPNHLVTTGTDDPSLAGTRAIIRVKGHQYRWLSRWLGSRNRTSLEVASMVVAWWIMAFVQCVLQHKKMGSHRLRGPGD